MAHHGPAGCYLTRFQYPNPEGARRERHPQEAEKDRTQTYLENSAQDVEPFRRGISR